MRRPPTRRLLLLGVLCAGTGLSGCAEIKGTANTPTRTQRPTAFYGGSARPTQPTEVRRERALDTFLRGKRPARPGPRPGQPDGEVEPQVGGIVKPGGSLDEVFDAPPDAPASGKGTYHRMRRGESLYAVQRRYGVPVEVLVRANQIQDPSHIPVGTRIFIPDPASLASTPRAPERRSFEPEPLEPATDEVDASPKAADSTVGPTPGKGIYHVVKDGDSLVGLSRYYGVSQAAIRQWNRSEVAQGLPTGCTVFIPGATDKAPPRVTPAGAPAKRVPGLPTGAHPQKVVSFRPAPAPPGFAWPVPPNVISRFGMRGGRPHTGLDIAAEMGTPIRAAMAGKVIYSGWMNGYGNVVILDHQNGYFTVYAHNQQNLVRTSSGAPQLVKTGQTIARVGQTGNASRPHVHFEVRRSNDALDPLTLLPGQRAPAFAARDGGVGRG